MNKHGSVTDTLVMILSLDTQRDAQRDSCKNVCGVTISGTLSDDTELLSFHVF